MFYDERIEAIKGRLSKNALLITFCYTLCYGGVRLFNILRNTDGARFLSLLAVEIFTVIAAGLTLLIGLYKRLTRENDERLRLERHALYRKAAKTILLLLPAVFSLLLPYVTLLDRPTLFADAGFGAIFVTLFLILGAYTVLTFRKNDVYFNYSLMEGVSYYGGVFRNIGRLALATLGYTALAILSALITALLQKVKQATVVSLLFDIILTYTAILTVLSVIYLVYSLLERKSYLEDGRFSAASVVSLAVTTALYGHYLVGAISLDTLAVSSEYYASITLTLSYVSYLLRFSFFMFFAYFVCELGKKTTRKLATAALYTVFSGLALSQAAGSLTSAFTLAFIRELLEDASSASLGNLISQSNMLYAAISELTVLVGASLALITLMREREISFGHCAAIGVYFNLFILKYFLYSQVRHTAVSVYTAIVSLSALVYCCILLSRIAKRQQKLSTDGCEQSLVN